MGRILHGALPWVSVGLPRGRASWNRRDLALRLLAHRLLADPRQSARPPRGRALVVRARWRGVRLHYTLLLLRALPYRRNGTLLLCHRHRWRRDARRRSWLPRWL